MSEPETSNDEGEEGGGIAPKDLLLFAARAARRHLVFCLLIGGGILAVAFVVIAALPKNYDATCKIFAQEGGLVTSSLASGREHVQRPFEGTRGLDELILARDNLLSVVREAKLVDTWPRTRPWPMRIKDKIQQALVGPPQRADLERAFVEMLASGVVAYKDGEGVRIRAQWRDPVNAYDIARLLQRNFLAGRAAQELGPIRRAIPVLEQQLQEADHAVERAMIDVQANRDHALSPVPTEQPGAAPAPAPVSNEFALLSRQLSEVRKQSRAMVELRRERISQLKLQLVDMKAQYSAEHPLILQQEARIAALNEEPEELKTLRAKEAEILNGLSARGIKVAKTPAERKEQAAAVANSEDPELATLEARLGAALARSDGLAARLDSARLELLTSEADFKHRYVSVESPEIPRVPLKAKLTIILYAASIVLALLIAVIAAALREYFRGRLVEVWQVRALGVELIGEVDIK